LGENDWDTGKAKLSRGAISKFYPPYIELRGGGRGGEGRI